jgi:hypothetical protein
VAEGDGWEFWGEGEPAHPFGERILAPTVDAVGSPGRTIRSERETIDISSSAGSSTAIG